MVDKRTTINVSEKVWKLLNSKKGVGDTFDDVLRRLLNVEDEHKNH